MAADHVILGDHTELMMLLHPDYPTPSAGLNDLYEGHLERVVTWLADRDAEKWDEGCGQMESYRDDLEAGYPAGYPRNPYRAAVKETDDAE